MGALGAKQRNAMSKERGKEEKRVGVIPAQPKGPQGGSSGALAIAFQSSTPPGD